MKNKSVLIPILILIVILIISFTSGQSAKFYYAFNEKIFINEVDNKIIIRYNQNKKSDVRLISLYSELSNKIFEWKDDSTCIISIDPNEKTSLRNKILKQPDVKTCNSLYTLSTGLELGATDEFVVKFYETVTQSEKEQLFKEFGIEVIKSTDLFDLLKVSTGSNVVEIANKIQETGLTLFSHPNFISKVELFQVIPNDPFFVNQFYLRNTGQVFADGHYGTNDADIDAPEAWSTTVGFSNIIVAVIDEGVTSNHFDLPNTRQIRLTGSDFGDGGDNDPSPAGNGNHGNACAGIVAATQNNSQGVSGVAPNCTIMPIRIYNSDGSSVTPANVALAIDLARQNGADIISNSWGYNSYNPNFLPVIVTAISNATSQGRNGRGCVVVFASGNNADHADNDNGYICFPANVTISGVLTVGASDRYDKQANYSPTSNPSSPNNQIIDLVAPSHKAYSSQITGETWEVFSIDIPNDPGYNSVHLTDGGSLPVVGSTLPSTGVNYLSYTGRMGGTSAACPQVAACAALILSINPNLTQQQVFNIIIGNADKVGGYTYSNGKCNQLGYGRLNVSKAVAQAVSSTGITISGPTLLCSAGSSYTINNLPSGYTIEWSSPSCVTRVSLQGSNPCTFSGNSGTSCYITAKIVKSGYGSFMLPQYNVWSGKPLLNSISGPYSGYTYTPYTFWTSPARDPLSQSQYEWQVQPPGYNYYFNYQYYDWVTITFYDPCEYYMILARATNTCGPSNWVYKNIAIYSGYGFSASPNPASEEVRITVTQRDTKANTMETEVPEFDVQIYDLNGNLCYTDKKSGLYFTLPVSKLRNGNYIISISNGEKKESIQLIVKH